MDGDRLRLDDQLCFALYAATNAVIRAYRPLLRELGITYPQYLTLMALWQHGDASVNDLAGRLDVPAHALTPLLQRLERAGLVCRERSARDGRSVRISLTAAGAALQDAAAEAQRRVVCATGLSPESLAALRGELHDLVHDMRASADRLHPNEGKAS